MEKNKVELSRLSQKQLLKAPKHIVEATLKWVSSVQRIGLLETRKTGGKGLHDEPLSGELKGLRSIRLNKSWRLYYREIKDEVTLVFVERIDAHKY
jgi:toxin HigB-1